MVEHEEKVTEKKETYLMRYQCYNCKTRFTAAIPVGMRAYGRGGKCPTCGIEDNPVIASWTHQVLGSLIPEKTYGYGRNDGWIACIEWVTKRAEEHNYDMEKFHSEILNEGE